MTVPISQNDEIGFLPQSFNAMVASTKAQVTARQQKEAVLQELTTTLEQRIAGRMRELAVLYDISAAAGQAQTIETLLTRSLAQAMTVLDAELGAAFLLETDSLTGEQVQNGDMMMQQMAIQGIGADIACAPIRLPAVHGVFAALFREREPLLVFDLSTDARSPEELRVLGQRLLLAAPLRADDYVPGALLLIHKVGQAFNAEEVALLGSIADQVGVSVQSSPLRQHTVVLEEHHRLARDLHDSAMQVLYGLVTLAETGEARLAVGSFDAIQPTFARIAATARQALNEIVADAPQAHILVLTSYGDDERVFPAIKSGALGYLLKDTPRDRLLQAIRDVARGQAILYPTIAIKVMRELTRPPPDLPPTTEPLAEREVATPRLIARGLSNQEIAAELVVHERTVAKHVGSILEKLQLANRTQAALYALREGLAKLSSTSGKL